MQAVASSTHVQRLGHVIHVRCARVAASVQPSGIIAEHHTVLLDIPIPHMYACATGCLHESTASTPVRCQTDLLAHTATLDHGSLQTAAAQHPRRQPALQSRRLRRAAATSHPSFAPYAAMCQLGSLAIPIMSRAWLTDIMPVKGLLLRAAQQPSLSHKHLFELAAEQAHLKHIGIAMAHTRVHCAGFMLLPAGSALAGPDFQSGQQLFVDTLPITGLMRLTWASRHVCGPSSHCYSLRLVTRVRGWHRS